jgi:hypothetical protein
MTRQDELGKEPNLTVKFPSSLKWEPCTVILVLPECRTTAGVTDVTVAVCKYKNIAEDEVSTESEHCLPYCKESKTDPFWPLTLGGDRQVAALSAITDGFEGEAPKQQVKLAW